ncbi:hypothetical protein HMN09_01363300 [Mycena chlorophos]|uniref:F-box domain-containing protein n=1 Tax=Mycena chlorophos TaxID=658473 RepID=A0A8H6RW00_MYCCL|nr:hypothetical protein HMN09_01363300 [Mycena chlorophos]
MSLLSLDTDILLYLLYSSDVDTVVRCSQVCRALHALSRTKHVWLGLIGSLRDRNLIELPPDKLLVDYSVDDLVASVKRVVVGPAVWRPGSAQPSSGSGHGGPVLLPLRTYAINTRLPEDVAAGIEQNPSRNASLLPGGRYILLRRMGGQHEIWDIRTSSRIWSHIQGPHVACELSDSGREILVACYEMSMRPPVVTLTKVSLHGGDPETVCSFQLPHICKAGWEVNIGLSRHLIALEVETASAQMQRSHRRILLVNWLSRTFTVLWGRFVPRSLNLTTDYLFVLLTNTSDSQARILTYSLAELSADTRRWQRLPSLATSSSLAAFGILRSAASEEIPEPEPLYYLTQTITASRRSSVVDSGHFSLAVHSSVLHANTYLLSVFHSGHDATYLNGRLVYNSEIIFHRYHVHRRLNGSRPSIKRLSAFTHHSPSLVSLDLNSSITKGFLSYAGYARQTPGAFGAQWTRLFYGPLGNRTPRQVQSPLGPRSTACLMGRYSPVMVGCSEENTQVEVHFLV